MFRKQSIFDKIDKFLRKRGHQLVMSIFLSSYNRNNIYVRFDFVPKMSVYKIVWFDLNFLDENKLEDYINVQMVTKFTSLKLVDVMSKAEYESGHVFDEMVVGDRVEILTYFNNKPCEFVFDRFLPVEWKFLIDPLVIIFSYLPRSMEIFLTDIFGKLDGLEEEINAKKALHYDIFNKNMKKLFLPNELLQGDKLYANERVTFLEKFEKNYFAIVDDRESHLVIINDLGNNNYFMSCDCKNRKRCKHIYATILAIKKGNFIPFYKVKYVGKDETLLEKISYQNFYFCFGVDDDKLLIVTPDGYIASFPIVQNNKVVFEVIEDDDDLSLSKIIQEYKK